VVETYLSLKEIKLSVLQNIGVDSYIRGLSTIEAGYLKGILALRKLIITESKRCGLVTHYRTYRSLKRFECLQMEKMPGGLEADLKGLFSSLEKKQNEKEPNQ
jgi:hypothetical protein